MDAVGSDDRKGGHMDRREMHWILMDDEGDPRFVPSFAKRFNVREGYCTACSCPVDAHWEPLHGDAKGWIGCEGARKATSR